MIEVASHVFVGNACVGVALAERGAHFFYRIAPKPFEISRTSSLGQFVVCALQPFDVAIDTLRQPKTSRFCETDDGDVRHLDTPRQNLLGKNGRFCPFSTTHCEPMVCVGQKPRTKALRFWEVFGTIQT